MVMREQTATMTSRAMAMPFQFLCGGLTPPRSYRDKHSHGYTGYCSISMFQSDRLYSDPVLFTSSQYCINSSRPCGTETVSTYSVPLIPITSVSRPVVPKVIGSITGQNLHNISIFCSLHHTSTYATITKGSIDRNNLKVFNYECTNRTSHREGLLM